MNNNLSEVVINHGVKHFVHLQLGSSKVVVHHESVPKINVISLGAQGPVGSIAENVLALAKEAKLLASEARDRADETSQGQQDMVSGMSLTIDHFIGAIGAQE